LWKESRNAIERKCQVDIIVINQAGVRKAFYEFPNDVAAALLHLGLAVRATQPASAPPAQTQTIWEVTRLPFSGKLCIQCRRPGGETVSFERPPAAYKAGLKYCDSNCPLEVLAEYARRYGMPELAGNFEAELFTARNQQNR
jgi:hypothetical protein